MELVERVLRTKKMRDKLDSGETLQNVISIGLQIIVILAGIASFIALIISWGSVEYMKFWQVIGFILIKLSLIYLTFYITKYAFEKFGEIRQNKTDKFVLGPIFCLIIRTLGEVYFVFYVFISLPLMISTWLGYNIVSALPYMRQATYNFGFHGSSSFVYGLLMALVSLVLGVVTLIITRFIAEITEAFFSIANDVNRIEVNSK